MAHDRSPEPERRHPRPSRWATATLVVALLAVGACGGSDDEPDAGSSTTTSTTTSAPDASSSNAVFEGGVDGVDTFRIPAVTLTDQGSLLAFAEARTLSPLDDDPHGIAVRRSDDEGDTWSDTEVIAPFDEETGCAPSDPAPIAITQGEDAGDVVVLHRSCREVVALPGILRSEDDGETWTRSEIDSLTTSDGRSPTGSIGTGPGHGIELQHGENAGRLVVSAWGMLGADRSTFLLLSDDGGRTWRIGATATGSDSGPTGVDETVVVEAGDGTILISSRNPSGGRTQARSTDGGETFEPGDGGQVLEHHPELVNPVVQGSLLAVDDGDTLLFASPSDTVERRGLRIWRSTDVGTTWEEGPLLVPGVAAYSDMVMLPDGETVGVLVETGDRNPYERIDLIEMPLSDLDEAPEPLSDDFEPREAVAGRLVVDGDRYPVTYLCLSAEARARVEVEGGVIIADVSKGFEDVPVTVDLEPADGEPLHLEGSGPLETATGLVSRGTLADEAGTAHDVDLVIVNAGNATLAPIEDCDTGS